MSDHVSQTLTPQPFVLPPRLIGRPHIARILRELEAVDAYMATQAIRNSDTPPVVPGISRVLRELIEKNAIVMTEPKHRQRLISKLRRIKDTAPVIHITFAVEPDIIILTELTTWVRAEIHDSVLLSVGVQPDIIGGCVVRTPDKVYDLSFKKHFAGKQEILAQAIKEAVSA